MNMQVDNVRFFVDRAVESSELRGHYTLFVVGIQPVQEILVNAFNHECTHIYLGANQSFEMLTEQDQVEWGIMLKDLLDNNIMVTLDYDVAYHSDVLAMGLHKYENFVPMVSVKLPHVREMNQNTVIKIDDAHFKHSNPGVWCHSINKLTQQDTVFTGWDQYQNTVIE